MRTCEAPDGVDPGMAFVLVQHLDPEHDSLLTELIQRYTDMRASEAEDGIEVEVNCVYIIPPGRELRLRDGRLRLQEPVEVRGHRLLGDVFFQSLAEERGEQAIAVVLSETGRDGTVGVRAVKERGGPVLVQDPDSAEHDGMPRSAIATGLVDHALPAAEIGPWLMADAQGAPRERSAPPSPAAIPAEDAVIEEVFGRVRAKTGHDFTQYKRSSICRRLQRRMAARQVASLEEYVGCLKDEPEEVEELFEEMLIGVTQFFRDPEAFEVMEKTVIPLLVDGRRAGSAVRVWVPSCSTGEEAYSTAILLKERLHSVSKFLRLQVFATDIDPKAVETARSGVYPASIAADVTPERLERFFTRERRDGSYRIHKSIRDLMVFSVQDLIADPPFSKIDLVSCRNLLIYLGPELQRKLMLLFHYALNSEGVLFLGTSETVGSSADRFGTIDRAAKLYVKKDAPRDTSGPPCLGRPGGDDRAGLARRLPAATPAAGKRSLRELTERELPAHDAPAAALVDAAGGIRYMHGSINAFLEPAAGDVGVNILSVARDGLKRGLTTALHQVVEGKEPALRRGLRVRIDGDSATVDLGVRTVTGSWEEASDLFLITLVTVPSCRAFPAAERWSEAEALQMSYGALVPREGLEETADLLDRVAEEQDVGPFQTTRITKDGRTLRLWVTATRLAPVTGEGYGIATTERPVDPSDPDVGDRR